LHKSKVADIFKLLFKSFSSGKTRLKSSHLTSAKSAILSPSKQW
jgi:hypothetical protein